MGLLHITNTNFEWELRQKTIVPLQPSLEQCPISLQLQFLPLLYAKAEEGIGVTAFPGLPFSSVHPLHLLSNPGSHEKVESWGASLSVQVWAKKHRLAYEMPAWGVVQKVNSKAFSFSESPPLKNATLLYSEKEVEQWVCSVRGPKVLKSCFGTAGGGHLLTPFSPERFLSFIKREGFPLIGEPWVNRLIDFSTQWIISKEGDILFLGETECVNDGRGQYRENRVGKVLASYLYFLEAHKEIAYGMLQKMKNLGYFGPVGFDAMLYEDEKLHPIVEINARKTMGFVALKLQQMHFPKQTISLSYVTDSHNTNFLPNNLMRADGSLLMFSKRLRISVLDK